MKLLRKTEVIALKERERSREAAEGIKLARKVDELRELQSNTEKKLNDFRSSSLQAITEEIKNLGTQRDILVTEVSSLKKKLDTMLPGMGTKRQELNKKENELHALEDSIKIRKKEAEMAEIDVAEAQKELTDSLARAKTDEERANSLFRAANEKDGASTQAMNRAKAIENSISWQKTEQERVFADKEAILRAKEAQLSEKEDYLTKELQSIKQERVKLADRNAMLDRTLARLKNARINV